MDLIRRLGRRCLGVDSFVYRGSSAILDHLWVVGREGLGTWRTLRRLANNRHVGASPLAVAFHNLLFPIFLRPGTADAGTVVNNIVREEYGHITFARNAAWMIDAGAYIGDTAAYFLSRFPSLRVVALEPSASSREIASENLKPYGDRVILLGKALLSSEGSVHFRGEGTGASIGDSGSVVECVSLPWLMEKYLIPHVDILKMDIEGAEGAIFKDRPEEWLKKTDVLIIEIHSVELLSQISDVLEANGFSMTQHRSVWYCRRRG